ncbi:MAG: DUF4349 domain-containing protein [Chitinophagaceae bacterium]|nr:DUF4349 domain-containing protein [Chitinophagaceae bacterium]
MQRILSDSFIFTLFLILSCNSDSLFKQDIPRSKLKNPVIAACITAPANEISKAEKTGDNMDVAAVEESEKNQPEDNTDKVLNAATAQQQVDPTQKKIIKDGSLSVRSVHAADSKKNIDQLLKLYQAYYESEQVSNNDNIISYNLKIRVAADNFEKMIVDLEKGDDIIQSKNIEARDVTEEFIDIESRLSNKKEYLQKYRELVVKAGNIRDVLEIEENIRTIQEEIESITGRLKYLNDQIAYSTLNVYLFQEKDNRINNAQPYRFTDRIKDAIVSGWSAIKEFILALIAAWPMVIICATGGIILLRIIRKRRSARRNKMNENEK